MANDDKVPEWAMRAAEVVAKRVVSCVTPEYVRDLARIIASHVPLDEAASALEPFAKFAEMFDAKPMNIIANEVYGIHPGTEWEAYFRLSDCRNALAALTKLRGAK